MLIEKRERVRESREQSRAYKRRDREQCDSTHFTILSLNGKSHQIVTHQHGIFNVHISKNKYLVGWRAPFECSCNCELNNNANTTTSEPNTVPNKKKTSKYLSWFHLSDLTRKCVRRWQQKKNVYTAHIRLPLDLWNLVAKKSMLQINRIGARFYHSATGQKKKLTPNCVPVHTAKLIIANTSTVASVEI